MELEFSIIIENTKRMTICESCSVNGLLIDSVIAEVDDVIVVAMLAKHLSRANLD